MMGAKHTAGPWQIVRVENVYDDDGGSALFIDDARCGEEYYIAEVHRYGKERDANAALISAAPDLLEALKLADHLFSGANMNHAAVKRKVEAAIAKATGVDA